MNYYFTVNDQIGLHIFSVIYSNLMCLIFFKLGFLLIFIQTWDNDTGTLKKIYEITM